MQKKAHHTLTIRLDMAHYQKLRRIAELDGRFVSQLAAWWLRNRIEEYEREHGTILPPEGT